MVKGRMSTITGLQQHRSAPCSCTLLLGNGPLDPTPGLCRALLVARANVYKVVQKLRQLVGSGRAPAETAGAKETLKDTGSGSKHRAPADGHGEKEATLQQLLAVLDRMEKVICSSTTTITQAMEKMFEHHRVWVDKKMDKFYEMSGRRMAWHSLMVTLAHVLIALFFTAFGAVMVAGRVFHMAYDHKDDPKVQEFVSTVTDIALLHVCKRICEKPTELFFSPWNAVKHWWYKHTEPQDVQSQVPLMEIRRPRFFFPNDQNVQRQVLLMRRRPNFYFPNDDFKATPALLMSNKVKEAERLDKLKLNIWDVRPQHAR